MSSYLNAWAEFFFHPISRVLSYSETDALRELDRARVVGDTEAAYKQLHKWIGEEVTCGEVFTRLPLKARSLCFEPDWGPALQRLLIALSPLPLYKDHTTPYETSRVSHAGGDWSNAALAVKLVCEYAACSVFHTALALGNLDRTDAQAQRRQIPLQAPLAPRLLFSSLLLRRLHEEHCGWLSGSKGSLSRPSSSKKSPLLPDGSGFVFQEAIFQWLDTRSDDLSLASDAIKDSDFQGLRHLEKSHCRRCAVFVKVSSIYLILCFAAWLLSLKRGPSSSFSGRCRWFWSWWPLDSFLPRPTCGSCWLKRSWIHIKIPVDPLGMLVT